VNKDNKVFIAFIFGLLLMLIFIPNVSAGNKIWEFDKFHNIYAEYGSWECKVYKDNRCPSEMSWQGDRIELVFRKLRNQENLPNTLEFNFDVVYLLQRPKLKILAGKYGGDLSVVENNLIINRHGVYSVDIPKELFQGNGKNVVVMKGKNINVGAGHSTHTLVIERTSLEK